MNNESPEYNSISSFSNTKNMSKYNNIGNINGNLIGNRGLEGRDSYGIHTVNEEINEEESEFAQSFKNN
jgi:hypothetical protein